MQAHIPIASSRIVITSHHAHSSGREEGTEGVFFFQGQFNRGAHPPARLLFTHTRSASTVRCKHEASIAWLKTLGRHEKWYSLVVVQFLRKQKKEGLPLIHTHLTSAICCSRLFIVGSTADANPLDIIFEASGFIAGAAESAILGNVKARTKDYFANISNIICITLVT